MNTFVLGSTRFLFFHKSMSYTLMYTFSFGLCLFKNSSNSSGVSFFCTFSSSVFSSLMGLFSFSFYAASYSKVLTVCQRVCFNFSFFSFSNQAFSQASLFFSASYYRYSSYFFETASNL